MTSSSTLNFEHKTVKVILALLLGILLLAGCEGPSTTVLKDNVPQVPAGSDVDMAVIPYAGSERLYEAVNTLYTGKTGDFALHSYADADTDTAIDPFVYILSVLRDCPYDVTQTGEIIEAVLSADVDDPDICLVIACYGGYEEGTSASDTAAGAAVLLQTAETLAGITGDTEIRFVFLPGERNETGPIYSYLEELYTPDADQVLGAVLIGGLGLNGAAQNRLGCADGKATFMAEQINRACRTDLGEECVLKPYSEGVMNVLSKNGIPAVVYTQKESLIAGTVLDSPAVLDYKSLQDSADILSHTLAYLCGESTPSMRARAHYTDGDICDAGVFLLEKDTLLPFGENVQTLENQTGLMGLKVLENTDNRGNEIVCYRFPVRWSGSDKIIPADFYYVAGALSEISVRVSEAGIAYGTVCDDMTDACGPGSEDSEGPYGLSHEWVLPDKRLHVILEPQKKGCDVSVTEYDTPVTPCPPDSLGAERLKDLYDRVIPQSARQDLDFEAYTDGTGGTWGRLTEQRTGADQKRWILGLDPWDVLGADASFRDRPRTVAELARLYGEYLARHDAAAYYDAYHLRFGGDEDDFAAAFRLFTISGDALDEAGAAADPLRFFCDFDELMDFRDIVRENLDRD